MPRTIELLDISILVSNRNSNEITNNIDELLNLRPFLPDTSSNLRALRVFRIAFLPTDRLGAHQRGALTVLAAVFEKKGKMLSLRHRARCASGGRA
jgi:hypothetical protein